MLPTSLSTAHLLQGQAAVEIYRVCRECGCRNQRCFEEYHVFDEHHPTLHDVAPRADKRVMLNSADCDRLNASLALTIDIWPAFGWAWSERTPRHRKQMTDETLRNLLREVNRKLDRLTDDVRDLQLRLRALESHMEALRTGLASGLTLATTRLDLVERRLHRIQRWLNIQDVRD